MDPFNIFDRSNNRAIAAAAANSQRRNVAAAHSLNDLAFYCEPPHNIVVSGVADEPRSSIAIATSHSAVEYYPTIFISGSRENCDRFLVMCNQRALCKSTAIGGLEPFRGLAPSAILSILLQLGKRYWDFSPSAELYTRVYIEALVGLEREVTLQTLDDLTLAEVFGYLNSLEDPKTDEKIGMIEERGDYAAFHALVSELRRVMSDEKGGMEHSAAELVGRKIPLIILAESTGSRDVDLLLDTVSLCVDAFAQVVSSGLHVCFDSMPTRYNEVIKRRIANAGSSTYWLVSCESFPALFQYDDEQIKAALGGRRQVILYRQDAVSAGVWSRLLGNYTKTTVTINPDGSVLTSSAQEPKVKEEQLTGLLSREAFVVTPGTDTIFVVSQ